MQRQTETDAWGFFFFFFKLPTLKLPFQTPPVKDFTVSLRMFKALAHFSYILYRVEGGYEGGVMSESPGPAGATC